MPRKVYTVEFKQTAVRLASSPGAAVERVAHELGVATWTLRRWMKEQLGTSRVVPRSGDGVVVADGRAADAAAVDPHARIRVLEAENRRLRMERDILKKATLFFAAEDQRHVATKEALR